jgi:hypothetical protein
MYQSLQLNSACGKKAEKISERVDTLLLFRYNADKLFKRKGQIWRWERVASLSWAESRRLVRAGAWRSGENPPGRAALKPGSKR